MVARLLLSCYHAMKKIPPILFISTVPSRAIAEAALALREMGSPISLKILYPNELHEERLAYDELRKELEKAQAVIIDLRGGGYNFEDTLLEVLTDADKPVFCLPYSPRLTPLIKLGSFSMKRFARGMEKTEIPETIDNPAAVIDRVQRIQRMIESAGKYLPSAYLRDARNFVRMSKYLYGGGKTNYMNMLLLLCQYLGVEALAPGDPIEPKQFGIFHPELGYFDDLDDYLATIAFDNEKPTLGAIFYGGMHLDQSVSTVRALMARLPRYNFIPVYTDGFHTLSALREYFFKHGRVLVDLIFSLHWFRLNGGPLGGNPAPTLELLKELEVPVITPAAMFMREVEVWRKSDQGLSPIEIICAITWPELDGCIEPIPACGMMDVTVGDIACKEVAPIEERMDRISSRIQKWINLKFKPNRDKRVAVILYNYPPGEASLGAASYLDTFQSIERLLKRLADQGYTVDIPDKPLSEIFHELHLINSARWLDSTLIKDQGFVLEADKYIEFFKQLPEASLRAVIEAWGEPPGKVMTANGKLLIPGIEVGNVFIGIQPSRPPLGKEDLAQAAHDKRVPPHHQYIGFYQWLSEVWKADAVVHIGTHGLAEFTLGKEVGMSDECFPDILIGNLPNLYFYHALNTSEATIAKRRLYGTLIGYNSPPYTTSDLYEDYLALEDMIHEYREALTMEPARAEVVKSRIMDKTHELNLSGQDLEAIHDELYEMKRTIIPKGLHVLGEEYSPEDCRDFLKLLLRYDREGVKCLSRILVEARGGDYDRVMKDSGARARTLSQIEPLFDQVVEDSLARGSKQAARISGLRGKHKKELKKTLEFGLEVVDRFANNGLELENLCRGLELKFIEPAPGGDVIRSPELLPTGRNIYQFDPNRVPTESAMERGAQIAENTLKRYLDESGCYPESVGVILWGFETTGTQGETIGQILSYLGLRLSRKYGSWNPQLVVIPLKELGRPRIDCLVNICGFFREMFPLQMRLLDDAFNLVAELDEPVDMNFMKKHSRENLEVMKDQVKEGSLDQSAARKIANARLFGPQAGEYGTRMIPLVEDSIWDTEDQLADAYISSMSHLHARNIHARKVENVYKKNIGRVDVVSQVLYSHDFDMVDLDHYYEFFGGLARSVEKVRGKSPAMLFSDTRREVIETESAQKTLNRSVRTRLLNPKWIDPLLEHDLHGAQKIAQRVGYLIGYAATTHAVDNWTWDKVAGRYVFDEQMRKRLLENNPFAARELMDRLLEAYNRGYWELSEEDLKRLEEAILEAEAWIEGKI